MIPVFFKYIKTNTYSFSCVLYNVQCQTVYRLPCIKKNRTFDRKVKWIFGEIRTFHNTDLDVSKVGLQSCLQH